jgi:cysteinyl-tRNA synthetase
MKLYNTLTKGKEPLDPLLPGHMRLYVCGPTVYDRAHLGNARPYVIVDVLLRLLTLKYKVTYVRNITDIDDKIIAGAEKSGISIATLTEKTTKAFHEDMDKLNILRPTLEPKATEHVGEMISMIQKLIDSGHAYAQGSHVLFDVTSYKDYGTLSGRSIDDMIAGARVEVAPYKKNPMDFVLWKPSKEAEPGWDSPWGRGRPGWHIECSAMSHKHLGESFDIHGGGQDLIFPHHENERAQSLCAYKESTFARHWMHNGILTVNGEKMSKSLGNFFTISDLLETEQGETIRLALLQTHYRQPLDWTPSVVDQAKATLNKFYTALRDFNPPLDNTKTCDSLFLGALHDDLNTPSAIVRLHELVTHINKSVDDAERQHYQELLFNAVRLLGLCTQSVDAWFHASTSTHSSLDQEAIESMIEKRQLARAQKDFKTSDQIRETLLAHGIVLEDTGSKTFWKRVDHSDASI